MIIDTIIEHGKISMSDLPNHLMIGQDSIENRLDFVLKKSDIRLIEDVLISSGYLDMLCDEINEELSQKDELNFADLAIKYNFSIKFITNEIEKRLGSVIDGVISEDKTGIMTEKYLKIVNAKARGLLRAQQGPANLNKMAKILKMDNKKFEIIVSNLMEEKEVDGEIKGGQFIPTRFLIQKAEIIKNKFKKDGCVEYQWAKTNFYINNIEKFLKSEIKEELLFLDTCAYSKSGLADLKENIESTLDQEGYSDVYDFLPVAFEEEDIQKILYDELKMDDIIFSDDTLLSTTKLQQCCKKLEDQLATYLEKNIDSIIGKSKKKSKFKKEDTGVSLPLTEDQILQTLDTQKVVEYIVDEDIREVFFKHLTPLLKTHYGNMIAEIEKQRNSKTSNIIEELNMRIKHLGSALIYTNSTIMKMVESNIEFNENHVEEAAMSFAEILLDFIVFTSAKKMGISMEKNVLRPIGIKGKVHQF